jgi:hypothetical protein
VSLLHAHLVFVTKYRRRLFTDTMLTFCEHTGAVCAELDVEPIEFNGEADQSPGLAPKKIPVTASRGTASVCTGPRPAGRPYTRRRSGSAYV